MKLNQLIKPLVVSCLVPLSLVAQADDKMNFVTLRVGMDQATIYNNKADATNSVEAGILGSIEAGRKLNDMFALGVEYQYHGKTKFNMNQKASGQNASVPGWAVRSDVLLATMTTALVQDAKVIPYIKLGLGASKNKAYNYMLSTIGQNGYLNSYYPGKNKTNFAWQLGAGLNVPMNDMFDVDVSYAFLDRGTVQTQAYTNNANNLNNNNTMPAQKLKLRDNVITLGVKFKF